jgi:hypothetical protein
MRRVMRKMRKMKMNWKKMMGGGATPPLPVLSVLPVPRFEGVERITLVRAEFPSIPALYMEPPAHSDARSALLPQLPSARPSPRSR